MLPVTVRVGAAGATQWVPINYEQRSYDAAVMFDVDGTLTYKLQYGFYNPISDTEEVKSITRSTTTATLTWFDAHSVKAGDCLVVTAAGAPLDGTYDIASVTSETVVTYTVANSGATKANGSARAQFIRTVDDTTVTGKSAALAYALPFIVSAVRAVVTAYTSGSLSMTVLQGR